MNKRRSLIKKYKPLKKPRNIGAEDRTEKNSTESFKTRLTHTEERVSEFKDK